MNQKEVFENAGFAVVESENASRYCGLAPQSPLVAFLKENYPAVIRDNEIKWDELKTALGLPVDEKTNGYGLNFIGRNVAKAKYAQKTAKELKINEQLSKNFDTAQNMVLKGDNLDCLKILKSYYSGQIKCIYIDPPYNTQSEEFVYPDKFDAEEREVLGLANLSDDDIARMEFSFGNKRSHNGWLSFMYPRLMLARDLLSKDGVIFISIDDNEQANLKLLCDEIFGEENLAGIIHRRKNRKPHNAGNTMSLSYEFVLAYYKNEKFKLETEYAKMYKDEKGEYAIYPILKADKKERTYTFIKGIKCEIEKLKKGIIVSSRNRNLDIEILNDATITNGILQNDIQIRGRFCLTDDRGRLSEAMNKGNIYINSNGFPKEKRYRTEEDAKIDNHHWDLEKGKNEDGDDEIKELFNISGDNKIFSYPKPISLIVKIMTTIKDDDFIILDFFAGSGTTGHAVMELNKDGGNRKFILCQIDEPIDPKKKKEAYEFCINNNLPPVISSITVERLRRAGKKIMSSRHCGLDPQSPVLFGDSRFRGNDYGVLDVGFKVFDTVDAPKLALDGEEIKMQMNDTSPLDRIYNMIFKIGLDNPTVLPEEIVKDCMYQIGEHYYITNAAELDKPENKDHLPTAIKSGGKIFIDGWTASINTTLQQWKEDVKIVF